MFLSPRGDRCVLFDGGNERTLSLWNTTTLKLVRKLGQGSPQIHFSDDGALFVARINFREQGVFNSDNGEQLGEPIPRDHKIILAGDGKRLVIESEDSIRIVECPQMAIIYEFPKNGSTLLAISPSGRTVVLTSSEKSEQVDTEEKKRTVISAFSVAHGNQAESKQRKAFWSSDGTYVAFDRGDFGEIWNLGQGIKFNTNAIPIAISPDGSRTLMRDRESVYVLDLARLRASEVTDAIQFSRESHQLFSGKGNIGAQYSRDGATFAVWDTSQIRVYQSYTYNLIASWERGKERGEEGLSPAGSVFYVKESVPVFRLFNTLTGQDLGRIGFVRRADPVLKFAGTNANLELIWHFPGFDKLSWGTSLATTELPLSRDETLREEIVAVSALAIDPSGKELICLRGDTIHRRQLSGETGQSYKVDGKVWKLGYAASDGPVALVSKASDVLKPDQSEVQLVKLATGEKLFRRNVAGQLENATMTFSGAIICFATANEISINHRLTSETRSHRVDRPSTRNGPTISVGASVAPEIVYWLQDEVIVQRQDSAPGSQDKKSLRLIQSAKAIVTGASEKLLLAINIDGGASLYDLTTESVINDQMQHRNGPILQGCFIKRGDFLLTFSNSSMQLWDAELGAKLGEEVDIGFQVTEVVYLEDQNMLIAATNDGHVRKTKFVFPSRPIDLRTSIESSISRTRNEFSDDAATTKEISSNAGDLPIPSAINYELVSDKLDLSETAPYQVDHEIRERAVRVQVALKNVAQNRSAAHYTAKYHLPWLREHVPESDSWHARWGTINAQQDNFKDAAEGYLAAAKMKPQAYSYSAAICLLGAGEIARFDEHMLDFLSRAEASTDAKDADLAAYAFVLSGSAKTPWQRVLALAKKAAESDSKSWIYHETMGASYFRVGEFDLAEKSLLQAKVLHDEAQLSKAESRETQLSDAKTLDAPDMNQGEPGLARVDAPPTYFIQAFLALTYYHQKQPEKCLQQRRTLATFRLVPFVAEDWQEQLRREILSQEIERVCGPLPDSPTTKSPDPK